MLGFEDRIKDSSSGLSRATSFASTTSEVSEVSNSHSTGRRKAPPAPPARQPATIPRDRSSSDPFSDPRPGLLQAPGTQRTDSSSSVGSSSSSPPSTPSAPLLSSVASPMVSTLSSASTARPAGQIPLRIRTFTVAPYLTNVELKKLCKVFPAFIKSPPPSRFPLAVTLGGSKALEEGRAAEDLKPSGGHGVLRCSYKPRDQGYAGTFWQRVGLWFTSLFGS